MKFTGNIVVPYFREMRSEDLNFPCVCTFTATLSSRVGAGKRRVEFKLICFHSRVQWREGAKDLMVFDEH